MVCCRIFCSFDFCFDLWLWLALHWEVFGLKMLEMIKRCYFLARKKSLASLNFVLIYGYDRLRCAPFSRHISQYLSMLQQKKIRITNYKFLQSCIFEFYVDIWFYDHLQWALVVPYTLENLEGGLSCLLCNQYKY